MEKQNHSRRACTCGGSQISPVPYLPDRSRRRKMRRGKIFAAGEGLLLGEHCSVHRIDGLTSRAPLR